MVNPGEEFAAVFFSRCLVGGDVPDSREFAPSVRVSRRLGMELGGHWTSGLGSLATEEIREDGLALYVVAPSRNLAEVDGENEALNRRRDDLLNGLLIQGVPAFMEGFMLGGANVNGKVEIRQFGKIRDVEPTVGDDDFAVGIAELRRMAALGGRLRRLQDARDGRWARLLRGIRVLLKANRERNEHGERLHQFVRALEGLIKPRVTRSRGDFAHRGQTFAVANAEAREALENLFDLRSG